MNQIRHPPKLLFMASFATATTLPLQLGLCNSCLLKLLRSLRTEASKEYGFGRQSGHRYPAAVSRSALNSTRLIFSPALPLIALPPLLTRTQRTAEHCPPLDCNRKPRRTFASASSQQRERTTVHSTHQTHYEVLGVQRAASPKDIRDAYVDLSKKHHPDKHQNDPGKSSAFVRINEAYTVLSNPQERLKYDRTMYGAEGGVHGLHGLRYPGGGPQYTQYGTHAPGARRRPFHESMRPPRDHYSSYQEAAEAVFREQQRHRKTASGFRWDPVKGRFVFVGYTTAQHTPGGTSSRPFEGSPFGKALVEERRGLLLFSAMAFFLFIIYPLYLVNRRETHDDASLHFYYDRFLRSLTPEDLNMARQSAVKEGITLEHELENMYRRSYWYEYSKRRGR